MLNNSEKCPESFSTLKVASSKVSLYIPVIMSKDLHLLPDLTPPKKAAIPET